MKVIFVVVSMLGGGTERVVSILANRFAMRNMQVIIMMTAGPDVDYRLDPRIQVIEIGGTSGGSLRKRLGRILKIRAVFKENKDAVILSFGPDTSIFAVMAAAFLKNKFVISERNDPGAWKYPRLRNIAYDRAEKLVFQTAAAAACFPARLQQKGCVIANPITGNLPASYEGERDYRIIAVGRMEPQKNQALLLTAFARFSKEYPDYTLHFYGKGSLEELLKKQVKELNIDGQVFFEGFYPDVTERIKDGAMYVLSSDYEGVSNSLLEAMAMGMPVIATDCPIGGSAMCIKNRENGLLVPVKDGEALYRAMKEIAANPQAAKLMGIEAARIRGEYSEESITGQWLGILEVFN